MTTLTLYLVLASTPFWYQGEGIACWQSMKLKAQMYVLETQGYVARLEDESEISNGDGGGKSYFMVDEANNVLRPVTCHKVKSDFHGQKIVLYRIIRP